MALPKYIKQDEAQPWVFHVNANVSHPAMLEELAVYGDEHRQEENPEPTGPPLAPTGLTVGSPDLDRYWLEVAKRCVRWDVKLQISLAGLDPRPGHALELRTSGDKGELGQVNYPEGRHKDMHWKQVGKEAAAHWRRLRGLPLPD